jgi:hypothetical protein
VAAPCGRPLTAKLSPVAAQFADTWGSAPAIHASGRSRQGNTHAELARLAGRQFLTKSMRWTLR